MFVLFLIQAWNSDDDDEPIFSPVMRKKAVKVKHVKRREKKFDKKVSLHFWLLYKEAFYQTRCKSTCNSSVLHFLFQNYPEGVASAQTEAETQRQEQIQREGRPQGQFGPSSVSGAELRAGRQAQLQILLRGLWHEVGCQVRLLHRQLLSLNVCNAICVSGTSISH